MKNKRKIIGGGLSGLAAAINFAKNDEKVEIHEAREDIGMQFHPNYQVLLKQKSRLTKFLQNLKI